MTTENSIERKYEITHTEEVTSVVKEDFPWIPDSQIKSLIDSVADDPTARAIVMQKDDGTAAQNLVFKTDTTPKSIYDEGMTDLTQYCETHLSETIQSPSWKKMAANLSPEEEAGRVAQFRLLAMAARVRVDLIAFIDEVVSDEEGFQERDIAPTQIAPVVFDYLESLLSDKTSGANVLFLRILDIGGESITSGSFWAIHNEDPNDPVDAG